VTPMASQLTLPLTTPPALSRDDFIVAPGNAEAVAFIDSWPDWPASAACIHGPSGSGKTHLALCWIARANAHLVDARALDDRKASELPPGLLVIDNVDLAAPAARDGALFSLFNRGDTLLLLGREAPRDWPVLLPDLASRFRALLALPVWAPDDALLAALARKLFRDRQLRVPDQVVATMIASLERSPAAIREFVDRLDREALAQKRSLTAALVRELLPHAS
jgi:chromosomal replication initiation ATPase DnaA